MYGILRIRSIFSRPSGLFLFTGSGDSRKHFVFFQLHVRTNHSVMPDFSSSDHIISDTMLSVIELASGMCQAPESAKDSQPRPIHLASSVLWSPTWRFGNDRALENAKASLDRHGIATSLAKTAPECYESHLSSHRQARHLHSQGQKIDFFQTSFSSLFHPHQPDSCPLSPLSFPMHSIIIDTRSHVVKQAQSRIPCPSIPH